MEDQQCRQSEGFRVRVESPRSPAAAFEIVRGNFSDEDPEVVIDRDELTVVYDTVDGDHRIQAALEIEPHGDGSAATYNMVVGFGGVVGKVGFIRRRMAAMMQRGVAEELAADLGGTWV